MELRALGPSDLSVGVFGLGTMTFGHESDEATSHALLDRYVEAGGNFIDTADVYSRGVSEEIIGRWLAMRGGHHGLVIATKARFAMSDDPADVGAGRSHLERAVDASLSRLGVDAVDLYQIHAWDPATPIEETMETLNDLVVSGKVRAVGVSNFLGWQLEKALLIADWEGWAPIVSVQPQYNLLSREIELELVPVCLDEGIGLLPWSPLGGGWLTGKYSRDSRPRGETRLGEDPNRGVEAYDLRNSESTWRILDVVRRIAQDRGVTMGQVALNWLRNRPGVSSVLLGCRTVAQLDDNLAALEWDLSTDEMQDLDTVSAPGIAAYPYGFLEVEAGVDVWERLNTRTAPPF
ncbi:MAG TPA: aldo/keto reductase [Acidimicrobiia bacterium]|jgi:aryl-alcohol dehydrogenase-like predicted oxidoreductase